MTSRELERLREDIDAVDERIVSLVARRLELASEIGLTKRRNGIAVRDPAREGDVVERIVRLGSDLSVPGTTSRDLAKLLIESAVVEQSSGAGQPLAGAEVLVVGGAGRMGEWICRFMSNRGASVKVWDPRRRADGYHQEESLSPSATEASIVVVASPLGAAHEDLRAVLECAPKGVVFDLCSVKSHISDTLRRAAAEGLQVTSVHPMFGPGAPTPRGLNVLVCGCGSEAADERAESIFSGAGASVRHVPLDGHDELMAYVLGLSHLTALTFGSALSASGRSLPELRKVQGTSFDRLASLAREMSLESRRVYHDIQSLNPNSKAMLDGVRAALAELADAALDADPVRFADIMDRQRDYLEVL